LHLGDEVCHPHLGIVCRDMELDGPLPDFEAKIDDGPHATPAIGNVNLGVGLLLWH
jgi:hypothetical protein